jgi:hypothetical protein
MASRVIFRSQHGEFELWTAIRSDDDPEPYAGMPGMGALPIAVRPAR